MINIEKIKILVNLGCFHGIVLEYYLLGHPNI